MVYRNTVIPHTARAVAKGKTVNISKVTTKFQATIPLEIRERMGLKAGDAVEFEITDDDTVIVRKAITGLDLDYLKMVEANLTEWHSEDDDALLPDWHNT